MNVKMDDEDLQTVLAGGMSTDELQDRMFRTVPLSNVTRDIRLDWEEECVQRLNGRRVIEAECDPNPELDEATPGIG